MVQYLLINTTPRKRIPYQLSVFKFRFKNTHIYTVVYMIKSFLIIDLFSVALCVTLWTCSKKSALAKLIGKLIRIALLIISNVIWLDNRQKYQNWIWQQADWPHFNDDIKPLLSDINTLSRLIGALEMTCSVLAGEELLDTQTLGLLPISVEYNGRKDFNWAFAKINLERKLGPRKINFVLQSSQSRLIMTFFFKNSPANSDNEKF